MKNSSFLWICKIEGLIDYADFNMWVTEVLRLINSKNEKCSLFMITSDHNLKYQQLILPLN